MLKKRPWLNDRQPIKVLKLLNDRHSAIFLKFKELKDPIQTIICRLRTAKRPRRAAWIANPALGLRSAQRASIWFVTHISLGRLPVTVSNSLNDPQSATFLKFKESKERIQIKLSYVD